MEIQEFEKNLREVYDISDRYMLETMSYFSVIKKENEKKSVY